jgi:hypothetical protein
MIVTCLRGKLELDKEKKELKHTKHKEYGSHKVKCNT